MSIGDTSNQPAEDPGAEVQAIELEELTSQPSGGQPVVQRNLELLRNVRVQLSVSVGKCSLTVRELFNLNDKSVLTLDRDTHAPVDVLLDGRVVARGHLVAVDDSFGVQITEVSGS